MKKLSFILLFFINIAHAAINLEVNPQKVQLGETFTLTLSVENIHQQSVMPDLSPLQQNFIIVGTERSLSYSMINGQSESTSRWSVHLQPKNAGVLPIPSLQIGNEKSPSSRIEVSSTAAQETTSAGGETTTNDSTIFFKTEVSSKEAWVNQQIIYTVKLYNRQNLMDAAYTPPQVDNGLIVSLGSSKRYQTVENEKAYIVEEEKYAIIPQKSGMLTITPPSFTALVYDYTPHKIAIRGQAEQVKINAVPSQFSPKNWLAAKTVELSEEYDQTPQAVIQGSTLTRVVTLKAKGVPGELLPQFDFGVAKEYKMYPEKPKIDTSTQYELMGEESVKITYLFNQAGKVTIPELKVPWFNTQTGKMEMATLPPRVLQVDSKMESQTDKPSDNTQIEQPEQKTSANPGKGQNISQPRASNWLPWIIALGFAVAWVITLLLFFWLRPRKLYSGKRSALKNIHEACQNNDPIAAQSALLTWAKLQWPQANILNLNDINRQVSDTSLKKEINHLSVVIYNPDKKRMWQGNNLWLALNKMRKKKGSKRMKKNLPPINPS